MGGSEVPFLPKREFFNPQLRAGEKECMKSLLNPRVSREMQGGKV
jgi:hypothetical protein